MSLRETNPGVFYSDSETVSIGASELAFLVQEARRNDKRRARICAHSDTSDAVHEMLICLLGDCRVRPHCHHKAESLHVIEGQCDLVLFDVEGRVTRVVPFGGQPDEVRYVRLAPHQFHTVIVRSEYLVFHETVRGPFRREDTVYPDWAPSESDADLLGQYFRDLDQLIDQMRRSGG